MKKRGFALALAAIIGAAVITGCGGGSGSNQPTQETAPEAQNETKVEEEKEEATEEVEEEVAERMAEILICSIGLDLMLRPQALKMNTHGNL